MNLQKSNKNIQVKINQKKLFKIICISKFVHKIIKFIFKLNILENFIKDKYLFFNLNYEIYE